MSFLTPHFIYIFLAYSLTLSALAVFLVRAVIQWKKFISYEKNSRETKASTPDFH